MSSAPASKISKITLPSPLWRYLVLFQSTEQFASWLAISSVCFLFAEKIFRPNLAKVPPAGLLIGMVLGSLFSVILAIPAKVRIDNSNAADFERLRGILAQMNYLEIENNRENVRFAPNLPRVLRWKEQNIDIHRSNGTIEIYSGLWIIRTIKKAIARIS